MLKCVYIFLADLVYSPVVRLNSLHRGKCISTFKNINCFGVKETYTTSTERFNIWLFWCVALFGLVEERKCFGGMCCAGPFCPTTEVAFFWIFTSLIEWSHSPGEGHALAQLVEALRYKPEGRGFDSR